MAGGVAAAGAELIAIALSPVFPAGASTPSRLVLEATGAIPPAAAAPYGSALALLLALVAGALLGLGCAILTSGRRWRDERWTVVGVTVVMSLFLAALLQPLVVALGIRTGESLATVWTPLALQGLAIGLALARTDQRLQKAPPVVPPRPTLRLIDGGRGPLPR